MSHLSKTTSKLYFKKYASKVMIITNLASIFRDRNLDRIRDQLETLIQNKTKSTIVQVGSIWNKKYAPIHEVQTVIELIDLLKLEKEFTTRVEVNTLNIYSNNDKLIEDISELDLSIYEVRTPSSDKIKDYLLTNPNTIIKKTYTHKYKVSINGLWDDATSFKEWAAKLSKVKTTKNSYKYGGYFYVADEKTLNLCRLYLSNKISAIEQLVNVDEI